ncbi:hypothetical protein TNIN_79081 [Trichonephila inaurata madagascariensis]|uniref:Uncharacterized protein n=1 Tax=Trichonephila inaurata madagascariensis TaxID=2747483 RepID=A0A8X6XIJ1_9ARAC|nr:hypothetical protein TNIN_79081 [Trichonephila inaurata madagascariensis]
MLKILFPRFLGLSKTFSLHFNWGDLVERENTRGSLDLRGVKISGAPTFTRGSGSQMTEFGFGDEIVLKLQWARRANEINLGKKLLPPFFLMVLLKAFNENDTVVS